MSDVMQIARTRCSDLEAEIAEREAENAKAREEIETLKEFLSFGERLANGASPATGKSGDADASESSVLSAVAAVRSETPGGGEGRAEKSARMPTRPVVPVKEVAQG